MSLLLQAGPPGRLAPEPGVARKVKTDSVTLDESDEEEAYGDGAGDTAAGGPQKELISALKGITKVLRQMDDRSDRPKTATLERALEGIGGSSGSG